MNQENRAPMEYSDACRRLAALIKGGHFDYEEEEGLALLIFCEGYRDGDTPAMCLALAKNLGRHEETDSPAVDDPDCTDESGPSDTQRVCIPATPEHQGYMSVVVTLEWVCPECGGPRGEVFGTVSYDGSRRLNCNGWNNPCGHVDKYEAALQEARNNGLNQPQGDASCSA